MTMGRHANPCVRTTSLIFQKEEVKSYRTVRILIANVQEEIRLRIG
jgi:hypothetical protein